MRAVLATLLFCLLAIDVQAASLKGVIPPLAAKAQEIVQACGSRVISSVRNTRVRWSGRISLHASGRAIDMAGNPACIYAHLRHWPGGVSTDYRRVHHVHVSYWPGGREWGARFAHWRPVKRHIRRYAHARDSPR